MQKPHFSPLHEFSLACLIHSLICCQDFCSLLLLFAILSGCFWLIVWSFFCLFIVVHFVLHNNFLGMRMCYQWLAIRAFFDISYRLLVMERFWNTNNSSVCCWRQNPFMSLWSNCGFVVIPIIKNRLHGLELTMTGQALVGFCGSERMWGLGCHSWKKFVSMHTKFFVQGSILESN